MLNTMLKSVIDQDRAPIVICDLSHTIVYMNPAAIENYKKRGGEALIGQSLLDCHNPHSVDMIKKVVDWFTQSKDNNIIYTFHSDKYNKDVYMVALRDDNEELVGYYEKHEFRDLETMEKYGF